MDQLAESEKSLKDLLSKKQPPGKIKKAHEDATSLNRELRNFKTQFMKDSSAIADCFEELASVMSSITGLVSESKNSANTSESSTLEMSYASLQKTIIYELGLDEFFGSK